jgi:hypothetical protein
LAALDQLMARRRSGKAFTAALEAQFRADPVKSLSENPLGHDMAGSALSARREPGANTRSGLGPGEEHRGRAEDAVPAAGGMSFHAGRRYLFGGKTALGIPARTAALPGTKTQAIMGSMGFRIGSKFFRTIVIPLMPRAARRLAGAGQLASLRSFVPGMVLRKEVQS